jgi:hypothetical protein
VHERVRVIEGERRGRRERVRDREQREKRMRKRAREREIVERGGDEERSRGIPEEEAEEAVQV